MNRPPIHRLYAWHASYFSGKVRCYLDYKQIPYREKTITLWNLLVPIKRHTGASVMPVVQTAEGQWLQDSSVIIDAFEARYPERPVVPSTPELKLAAYLLEAWGDEWWIPVAMHSRWSYPENYRTLFEPEIGGHLLPGWPRGLQNRAVGYVAGILRGMLPSVGVRPAQWAWIEAWTVDMLDLLETHFAEQAYLLGPVPTLADFGLVGTFYGHLARDPWPAREWMAARPHLSAWVARMAAPQARPVQGTLADLPDQVPPTLAPVLACILREFVPMMEAVAEQVRALHAHWPQGRPLPRGLEDVSVENRHGVFKRRALPFSLWMVQRVQDAVAHLPMGEQIQARQALRDWGSDRLLDLHFPRLRQHNVRVAFAE